MKKNRQHIDFEEILSEELQDPELALSYLNEALANNDQRVFLLALKDVLKAFDLDISAFAIDSQISRQSIYRMLSKTGNPRWDSLSSLLNALGWQVQLIEKQPKAISTVLNLDKKLHTRLTREAAKHNMSLSNFISKKLNK